MSLAAACRLLALFLVLLPLAAPARALDFWSESVAVDVTAENAVAARAKGLEQGQREAFKRLLERLVPEEERARLPRVESLLATRYVRAVEIRDERVAPNRWLATLVVGFDPDAVRELLAGRGIALLEPERVPAILVVPAVRRGRALAMWAREEPWWRAWERIAIEERGLEVRLPLGDVRDLATFDAEELETGDRAALDRLAERYGAADAVVALAFDPEAAIARNESPRVEFFAGGGVLRGEPPAVEPARGEGDPLDRAARAAARRLVESWKRQTVARADRLAELSLSVPLADLASWLQIRRTLEASPEIRAIRLVTMARDRVELVVSYAGDLARLREGLARRGLELVEEREGWRLRRAAAPPGTGPG
ncbi:MAG: DUF2066 domain-containing protein [Geminicoccaceae bacterium]|nr:DUF2066 domain-containing protein [Geminicoccaceae bacterium]MCX7629989.1 DUF2066 domain-containing protein [Geminicoccaceae bacterium]